MQALKPMWTKSQEKKRAKKRHAGNFAAGYVKIDERHLLRTGLRGRKRWLFCCGATLLILLAIGNLALNCLLLAVLRIGPTGLPYMVLGSNNRILFPQSFNSSEVQLTGRVSSYENSSTQITSPISVTLLSGPARREQGSTLIINSSQITIDHSSIELRPYESFSVFNETNQLLFSVNETRAVFEGQLSLSNLDADRVIVSTIVTESLFGERTILSSESLQIQSEGNVEIGSTSENINAAATDYVILDAGNGIRISGIPSSDGVGNGAGMSYQLCICDSGKLFRVPETCSRANEINDPCEL